MQTIQTRRKESLVDDNTIVMGIIGVVALAIAFAIDVVAGRIVFGKRRKN